MLLIRLLPWTSSLCLSQRPHDAPADVSWRLGGYFGYDTVRYVEPKLADSCPRDELGVPDIWLNAIEEVVVFDNLAGALTLVVNADTQNESAYALAVSRLDALEAALSQPISPLEPISLALRDAAAVEEKVIFSTDETTYKTGCRESRPHIAGRRDAGCAISAHDRPFKQAPLTLYRALRNLNPSPYLYFVDLGDFQIVGILSRDFGAAGGRGSDGPPDCGHAQAR